MSLNWDFTVWLSELFSGTQIKSGQEEFSSPIYVIFKKSFMISIRSPNKVDSVQFAVFEDNV